MKLKRKIGIVGVGQVGATTAFTLLISGLVTDLVLIDLNSEKTFGEVLDLAHGIPLCPPADIFMGNYADLKDADIVIIAAGANQQKGESRLDLNKRNADIFAKIVPQIVAHAQNAILLVVTNPVDVLTYVTLKLSGLPASRVIGSGTVLDTSRLKYLLSKHTGLDARNVHSYVLGEHGDTELAAWSATNIAGMSMDEYCHRCNGCEGTLSKNVMDAFEGEVKNVAYRIIEAKGATYYAVALAVRRIVEAILRDEQSILTVSSFMDGLYDLSDVCLSLPSVIGATGVERVLTLPLDKNEQALLSSSGTAIRQALAQIGY